MQHSSSRRHSENPCSHALFSPGIPTENTNLPQTTFAKIMEMANETVKMRRASDSCDDEAVEITTFFTAK